MKRQIALFLLVCMALAVVPAMAANEFLGNMEVVNCREWVSLRETPSASARRLKKVPLGSVAANCRQHGDGWIFASYDDCDGYIQEQYLQVCEGMSVCSAMLVAGWSDGADLYETMGALTPVGFIPPGTIVRSCTVMASGRAYVECGSLSGYVSAELLEPYSELMHFPRSITLRCSLFSGAYDGPAPALMAADAAEFPLSGYAYSEYTPESWQIDPDSPMAEFVLYADTAVTNVHLFSISLESMDIDTGEAVYDFVLEHIQPQVDPEHPLSVHAVIYGDSPNWAVGYEDWTGAYHFAFVEISGEDGRILLREF